MATPTGPLDTLQDIRKMMERSSRFISLSGWSGIAAGLCGLAGAFMAHLVLKDGATYGTGKTNGNLFTLLLIAVVVFFCAIVSAFFFTWLRSRRTGTPIWGTTARRLLWNVLLPMVAGGLLILRLIFDKNYVLIAPCALLFYGLALVNGSKYTLGEIRYAGYTEILLGALGLAFPWHGLLLWTLGFGAVHIFYGGIMWWKYERLSGATT